ncbi:MAG: hypothetical protein K9L21_05125 [Spirochaetia bacterium]|nr:hypothetical protein [Spirochaetia bacterium]
MKISYDVKLGMEIEISIQAEHPAERLVFQKLFEMKGDDFKKHFMFYYNMDPLEVTE